tara:strand:- start:181 stop:387 length:207 start_codon:yes stop_codon:yes gene_type:complete
MKEVNNIYVLTDDDIDRIIVAFNNDDYEWILYFFENLRKLKLKKQDVNLDETYTFEEVLSNAGIILSR